MVSIVDELEGMFVWDQPMIELKFGRSCVLYSEV